MTGDKLMEQLYEAFQAGAISKLAREGRWRDAFLEWYERKLGRTCRPTGACR